MDYTNIPLEKFKFANTEGRLTDKKIETKPVSYARDVWKRFCKNKSSVVAACIIAFLLLFAIFVPIIFNTNYATSLRNPKIAHYNLLLPKCELTADLGFWDGCSEKTVNKSQYLTWVALTEETGVPVIKKVIRADYKDSSSTSNTTFYDLRVDSYYSNGMMYETITKEQYLDIQRWQNETGIQVIYPAVDRNKIPSHLKSDANIWYECNQKGAPVLKGDEFKAVYLKVNSNDIYDSIRVEGDDGSYFYSHFVGTTDAPSYQVRVLKYNYFQYLFGHEPSFLFGTNARGQDILTRLAAGARFSLVLAVCISAVNLFIGAIYGAIEGYYGGIIDLVMERISDVLGGVPSMVVMSLFQLHLAAKVGPVWSLVFAFVLTGWLGMAGRTRMQFYRFKHQEYVLSARTLGASDARLIFKHIFPNAMGTLITGSVLSIPGVIFSESSLTYLGIVNLESSTQTSVGTLLSGGNSLLSTFPHVILFPALFISLLMISFNLFGNGLRDAFNPSLKGVED